MESIDLGSTESWRSRLREDELVAYGRQIAKALPQTATSGQIESARKSVSSYARYAAGLALVESPKVDEQWIQGELEKVNDLREQMPQWQQNVTDQQKALDDVRSVGIRDKPQKPPMTRFLVGGWMLGTIFGLIAATTLASVLRSIWRPQVADPETFYLSWGVAIGLLIGWTVGTAVILLREHSVGAGWFIRWVPFLLGACLAFGLAGYRFLQPGDEDPTRIAVRISGVAVVLLFCEIGILLGIEFVNHVALHAWEQHREAADAYDSWAAKERAALTALAHHGQVLEEARNRLRQGYADLERLHRLKLEYQTALQERETIATFAEGAALRGFDLGWSERRAGL